MRNKRVMISCEIAIMAAFAYVLGFLKFYEMPNGGSISLSMLPIILIAVRRGALSGVITGLIFALLHCLTDAYGIVYFPLDYAIPFGILGLAGLKIFRKNDTTIFLGLIIVFALRYFSHVISGVVYWDVDFNGSITYNAPYVIGSALLTTSVFAILLTRKDVIYFMVDEKNA